MIHARLKPVFPVLFIGLFFLGSYTLRASDFIGGAMNFKRLGGDTFLITVKGYHSCNTTYIYPGQLGYTATCSGKANVATTYCCTKDVTPTCAGYCNRCTVGNCSFAVGIKEVEITGVAIISSAYCCKYIFWWDDCCRAGGITTGSAGENTHLESTVNICRLKGNSPEFNNPALMFFYKNQCIDFFNTAKGNAGDSLVYKLVQPLKAAGAPITYSSGYSYSSPFAASTGKCGSFKVDTFTGEITFTPQKEDITVYAIKVEQWQKNSGYFEKVAEIIEDVQGSVFLNGDNSPEIVGINSTKSASVGIPVGKKTTFTLKTNDPDAADSVFLTWINPIQGMTLSLSTDKHQAGDFTWKPDSSKLGSHTFIAEARDNLCPLYDKIQRRITVIVQDTFAPFNLTKKLTACGTYCLTANSADTIGEKYSWEVNYAPVGTNSRTLCYKFPADGKYIVRLSITKGNYYPQTLVDTVIIKYPVADAGKDTGICEGKTANLHASGGVTYKWTASPTLSSTSVPNPVANPKKTETYFVEVTDANGCTAKDSVKVTVWNIKADAGRDTTICPGVKIRLNATGGKYYLWKQTSSFYGGGNTANPQVGPKKTETFYVTASDSAGCTSTDSVTVFVKNYSVSFTAPSLCLGEKGTIIASGAATYKWLPKTGLVAAVGDSVAAVSPAKDTWFAIYTTKNGCSRTDSVLVKVFQKPVADFSFIADCAEKPVPFTDKSTNPAGSKLLWNWDFGDGGSSTLQNPSHYFPDTGTYQVTQKVINSEGCESTVKKPVTIIPVPKPDFKAMLFKITATTRIYKFEVKDSTNYNFMEWHFNDASIDSIRTGGSVEHGFKSSVHWPYRVRLVTKNASTCTSYRDTLIYVEGIETLTNDTTGIRIYPNPANTILYVETEGYSAREISLFNAVGMKVFSAVSTADGIRTIDVSTLPSGIYLVSVVTNAGMSVQKVVIAR